MIRTTTPLCLALAMFGLMGCPATPDPGSGNDNANSNSNLNLNGGVVVGGQITPEQRALVLEDGAAKFNSLLDQSLDDIGREMLAWTQARPEFRAAERTDGGSIVAVFVDGLPFVIPNNREFRQSADIGITDLNTVKPRRPTQAPRELPIAVRARLVSLRDPAITPNGDLRDWLVEGGYQVEQTPTIEVDDLKNINGSHGVVYFDTHGGRLPRNLLGLGNPTEIFVLETNTPCTAANLLRYDADVRPSVPGGTDWAMISSIGPVHFVPAPAGGRPLTLIARPSFCITATFVNRYMSFATDSLVMVNACESDTQDFKNACFAKGASVYAGWSESVFDTDAVFIGRFLFDYLLGANEVLNTPPLQSARTWFAGMHELRRRGWDTWQSPQGGVELTPGGPVAFVMTENPSEPLSHFAELSPSIFGRMRVDEENGLLIISGFFGERPGRVTINGTRELELVGGWGVTQLTCRIPSSGPNASGDVQVWVGGRPSNRAALTMWEGTFHFNDPGPPDQGSAELHVIFRADVRYDLTPDATLPLAGWGRVPDLEANSAATSIADGTPLPLNRGLYNGTPDFAYYGSLVPANRTLYFWFEQRSANSQHWFHSSMFGPDPDSVAEANEKFVVPLTFASDYSIQAGNRNEWRRPNCSTCNKTMSWSAIPAQHPPDVSQGR